MRRLLLAIVLAFPLVSACADACETLASDTCARLGEQSAECARIRTRAEAASPDDKRVCSQALAVSRRLTPKQ